MANTHARRWAGISLVAVAVCVSSGALAQSLPTLKIEAPCSQPHSCGSLAPGTFVVDQDGGVVARGVLGVGTIPATGAGMRTVWFPFWGAFRSGAVDGTQWDDANVGFYSWAGGYNTRATAYASFAFGDQVTVTGVDAAGFGASHTVSGTVGFATGNNNRCTGFGCVAMGHTNRASGQGSIAIGERVIAAGDWTVALGRRATSCAATSFSTLGSDSTCPGDTRVGSFTWADASTTNYLGAVANNSFNIRAAGGVRLYTNASLSSGQFINGGGSTWQAVSDRNAKSAFQDVKAEEVLGAVAALPITTWRYNAEEDQTVRHIGPMAQDWQRLISGPLRLNADSLHIDQSDMVGVALAAIQALESRTRSLEGENAALRAGMQDLIRVATETQQRYATQEALLLRVLETNPAILNQLLDVSAARNEASLVSESTTNAGGE